MSPVAAVVGSGPNGLTAACALAREGFDVTVYEAAEAPGGALRSAELFGEGIISDLGASVHPLNIASPAYDELLAGHDLGWRHPEIPAAHALDGTNDAASPVLLRSSLEETAAGLGEDGVRWRQLIGPMVEHWDAVRRAAFTPPSRPFTGATRSGQGGEAPSLRPQVGQLAHRAHALLQVGARGGLPAAAFARLFRSDRTRALFAGLAGHSTAPLTRPMTSAFGVILAAVAHSSGWPVVQGGSQRIVDALTAELHSHGGRIETGFRIEGVHEAPLPAGRRGIRRDLRRRGWRLEGVRRAHEGARARRRTAEEVADVVVLDVTPAQLLRLQGLNFPQGVQSALRRWEYGSAVVKVDYLLHGPVPWSQPELARAGTVHLGGTAEQIVLSEAAAHRGVLPGRPYVLMAQPSAADPTRTPDDRTVAWAYAHVPRGLDATGTRRAVTLIEEELSRQAPGFRDAVAQRRVWGPAELESWNENLVDGTISGGLPTLMQTFSRPARPWKPYTTGVEGVYLCSSATPPGGGAHGMGGWNAAHRVLRDVQG
ncbi:phytoene desaturase family protein [Nesterenkonia flava]|uniref:NAD(P)/FAD-dependent oxidoreductase n=1 Tax=Nesterenkonia flava TaxID=469799 RepID=A0ABU1FSA8_9MICC|nr:NAD(P)/FAD-dependent oxidoreductase [Nesterenkonia flava]MDR5711550.1 NAD(P)/FAD-dependent oxidoreductase [Nesterenkonia flava]